MSRLAKRAVSAFAAIAIALGGVAFTATSASAHTGDLNASAVCNTTTGQFDVTYTLTTSKTALDGSTMWRVGSTTFESTPTSNAGMDRGPVSSTGSQTVTLGTISVPGTSTKAPWAYAFTTWTDGFTKGSDGGDIALAGNCVTPPTEVTPHLTFTPGTCLAAGSVDAVETADYSWTVTGPKTAKVYTAVAKGNVTLVGQTIFGPYDLSQTNWKDASCQPTFTVEQSCGYVKITYHNNSKWDRWPDYRYTGDGVTGVDYGSGLTYTNVKVAAGTSKVIFEKTFTEDLNGGSVNVWYQDILGAERDIDTSVVELIVKTDCVANPVTTETVTFSNHSCDALGTVVAPDVEGVRYEADINGTVTGHVENFPAGTFYATDDGTSTGAPFYGTITIMAFAKDGYVLKDGATIEWTHKFTKPDCTKPPVLAYTGGTIDPTPWYLAGGFLLSGGIFITWEILRRRKVIEEQ